jgi:Propeptide_C25
MKRVGIISLIFVLAVVAMLLATHLVTNAGPSLGDEGRMTFTLNAGDYTITKDQNRLDVIQMEGFSTSSLPGNPILPHKVYNIAVPPDIIWSSLKLDVISSDTHVLEGKYDIKPAGPILTGTYGEQTAEPGEEEHVNDTRNMEVYRTDADFPEKYVKSLPYSQMRKWKFSRVDFIPFQYNPVSQKLTLIQSVTIEISYKQSPTELDEKLMSDTFMDDFAAQILLNYDAAKSWYRAR